MIGIVDQETIGSSTTGVDDGFFHASTFKGEVGNRNVINQAIKVDSAGEGVAALRQYKGVTGFSFSQGFDQLILNVTVSQVIG